MDMIHAENSAVRLCILKMHTRAHLIALLAQWDLTTQQNTSHRLLLMLEK
jgi:hypothetical protein